MNKIKTPSRQDILDFFSQQERPIIRHAIARAFYLKGQDRLTLNKQLDTLVDEGVLVKKGKFYQLTHVADYKTLRLDRLDSEGEMIAVPLKWEQDEEIPLIYVRPSPQSNRLKMGDVFYAQLHLHDENTYEAAVVRIVEKDQDTFIAVFHPSKFGGILYPVDRKDRNEYVVDARETTDAKAGDIVEAMPLNQRRTDPIKAKIVRVLGALSEPKIVSLIALKRLGIPYEFKPETIAEANQAQPPVLGTREDLRHIPFVTIDDEDARDFDDAVYARPDGDPNNPKGWHIMVAIADVSHYVAAGSLLDQEAYERGNSVYFPDRVVPMLPEALSNELCSLKPNEDRACVAVHLWIDANGKLRRHQFVRGLMRSAARLTYLQAQMAWQHKKEGQFSHAFLQKTIFPLFKAYECLKHEREERGPLNLDSDELRVYFSEDGKVAKVSPRMRYDSHRLIEEMMILANVAAAIHMTDRNKVGMFRVHDEPPGDKLDSLREYLQTIHLKLAKGQVIRPKQFNQILEKAQNTLYAKAVRELVLRSQAQAVYSPDNMGHYGLNLARYCHFTSPIRRYADLLVHRALTQDLKGGDKEGYPYTYNQLKLTGEHLSLTERRADTATRETLSRYLADYLSHHIGETFRGYINGVTRYGLFVTLQEYGVDGILFVRDLRSDYFVFDERHHRLRGRHTKKIYALGDVIDVKIIEASLITGRILLAPVEESTKRKKERAKKYHSHSPKRSRKR